MQKKSPPSVFTDWCKSRQDRNSKSPSNIFSRCTKSPTHEILRMEILNFVCLLLTSEPGKEIQILTLHLGKCLGTLRIVSLLTSQSTQATAHAHELSGTNCRTEKIHRLIRMPILVLDRSVIEKYQEIGQTSWVNLQASNRKHGFLFNCKLWLL